MKKKLFALLTAVLMLAVNVSIVFAAPPKALHIEVLEFIGPGTETFTATGAAVDDGLVCATGFVSDVGTTVGNPNGPFQMIWTTKHFDCGDGTFDMKLIIKLDLATNNTTAKWRVTGGTGAYAGLKGNGTLVGTAVTPGVSIYDVYDGKVH